jgi:hypothetical protein
MRAQGHGVHLYRLKQRVLRSAISTFCHNFLNELLFVLLSVCSGDP